MSGWIKLHKSLLEWEWFKDHKTVHVFNYCLLKANFKEGKWQGKTIPAGSFVSGRKQIAQDTGLSEQEVRTAIFKLKSTSNLTIKSTSKYSIISIANWHKYQAEQPTDTQESNQPATTIEEGKKKERRKNIQAAKPPDVSDQVWQDFVEHRKAKKAPLTETALKQIEREALKAGWTMEDALSEVCARAWQGFKADWVESRSVASKQENTFTGWRRDLANEIPPADVAAWFKTATVEDGRMIVDKKFTADWIKSHYAVQIEKVLGRVAIEVRK
jgi:hypothetical protein